MGKYDDMVDAALTIVVENGIRSLTLPLLFQRAHTGAGTFYHYFKSREDLIDAVFDRCYDVAQNALSDPSDAELETRERFDVLCYRLFKASVNHPRELNFLYLYAFGYVEPDEQYSRIIPSIMLLTAVISEAQHKGLLECTTLPSVLARVVRGMVASFFWAYEHGAFSIDDKSAKRFADGAWRAMGGVA